MKNRGWELFEKGKASEEAGEANPFVPVDGLILEVERKQGKKKKHMGEKET
jgi:hypothetical protein